MFPIRNDWLHFARGICMGTADIIPGVSGGTVALILGIYQRLVTAISHVDAQLFRHLGRREWRAAAVHLDLRFLIALATGIASGILGLAGILHYLLQHHRGLTYAAFFGLILASSLIVARMVRPQSSGHALLCWTVGIAAAFSALWLVSQRGLQAQPGLPYVFLCAAVAICAMILPGISGAYILVLLGKYDEIIAILKRLPRGQATGEDLATVAVFAAGCLIGLVLFSKILRWLLVAHWSPTMAALAGFMVGSLYKLWPFQRDTTPEVMELKHKVFEPIWPAEFSGHVAACLLVAVVAMVVVIVVDRLAQRVAD